MRKYSFCLFVLLFVFFFGVGFSYGYEQKGFLEYNEGEEGISFVCEGECYISIGEITEIDGLKIGGMIDGIGRFEILREEGKDKKGVSAYILRNYSMDVSIEFNKFLRNSRNVSEKGNFLIRVYGNIKGNLVVEKNKDSFFQRLKFFRKEFWNMEYFDWMSTMYRNGIFIGGTSIIEYGYIGFLCVSICILIFVKGKNRKVKSLFFVGIGMFLFLGIRNTVTYTHILDQGISGFRKDQSYFEYGDYIRFVDQIRKKLDLGSKNVTKDNCKIFINTNVRVIYDHGGVFLWPCKRVIHLNEANYIIYYGMKIQKFDLNKKILLEYNDNYLLDNNSK